MARVLWNRRRRRRLVWTAGLGPGPGAGGPICIRSSKRTHTHSPNKMPALGGGGDGGTRTLFNDFFVDFFEIFHGRASVLFTGILPLRKHTIKTNKNKASLSKSAGLGRGKKT